MNLYPEGESGGVEFLSPEVGIGNIAVGSIYALLASWRIYVGQELPSPGGGTPFIPRGALVTKSNLDTWARKVQKLVVVLVLPRVPKERDVSLVETASKFWEEKIGDEIVSKQKAEVMARKAIRVYQRCAELLKASAGVDIFHDGSSLDPNIVGLLKLMGDDLADLVPMIDDAVARLLSNGDKNIFDQMAEFVPPEETKARSAVKLALIGAHTDHEFNKLYEGEREKMAYADLSAFLKVEFVVNFIARFFRGLITAAGDCASIYKQMRLHKPSLPDLERLILDSVRLDWVNRYNREIDVSGQVGRVPNHRVLSALAVGLTTEFMEKTERGGAADAVLNEMSARYDLPANLGYDPAVHANLGLPLFIYILAALANTMPELVPARAIMRLSHKSGSAGEQAPSFSRVIKGDSAKEVGLDGGICIVVSGESNGLGPCLYLVSHHGKDGKIQPLPVPKTLQSWLIPNLETRKLLPLGRGLYAGIYSPSRRKVIGFVDLATYQAVSAPIFESVIPKLKEVLLK